MSLNICFHNIASIMREWWQNGENMELWGKCFDLFQVGEKHVKTIICYLSLMPQNSCTNWRFSSWTNLKAMVQTLWLPECCKVQWFDMDLIYWYSRTVLTLSIIVWHFHNFEVVLPFISNCLLEIKSCISSAQISWKGNQREIWTLEDFFCFV